MAAPPPKPKPRTIVTIDGFNFSYGAVKGGPYKWLNLERFFTLLRPHDDICQIHYFTAMVTGPALPDQQVYLRALDTLPLVNIILGNYKAKQVTCKVPACTHAGPRRFTTVEEKRTDVNIAVQMMEDAYKDRCDQFVLVSGDSDLVPLGRSAQGEARCVSCPRRCPGLNTAGGGCYSRQRSAWENSSLYFTETTSPRTSWDTACSESTSSSRYETSVPSPGRRSGSSQSVSFRTPAKTQRAGFPPQRNDPSSSPSSSWPRRAAFANASSSVGALMSTMFSQIV